MLYRMGPFLLTLSDHKLSFKVSATQSCSLSATAELLVNVNVNLYSASSQKAPLMYLRLLIFMLLHAAGHVDGR